MDVLAQTERENSPFLCLFFFSLGLQLIEWYPPKLGRAIYVAQFIDGCDPLSWKHPHRHTRNNVLPDEVDILSQPSHTVTTSYMNN